MSIPNPRRLDDLPVFLTVPEAAVLLRLGRTACYEAVARGEIPAVKFGAKLRIPRGALLALACEDPLSKEAGRAAGPHEPAGSGAADRGAENS